VLYRKRDGAAVAMRDQCPHRKVPLSRGRVVGDDIECGYHGMTFGPEGRCVRIPGQSRIPPAAKVASYPVTESMGLVWLWLGEREQAAATPVFRLDAYDDPE
ncbi:MAG: Rieske 2Fe-2S domain-containing protein, partial [Actinobacteria bacterium]|nr:Rieske 2Fe-2S domain-containing protein [Actinomycetota bacterium]NIS30644.1 Rieske 2Fe-2S domain-containing protein [Actinomycetota bacterium]NIU65803.1 Rieske 2Fe-2S domain-containing protein [Actinomycetota bacterium]NIW27614.1 Rieske 2Fe-2S domain-containing protein [Actinomycetota bacterium]